MLSHSYTGFGRVASKDELRRTTQNTAVLNFSMAVRSSTKKDAPAAFVRCTLFGERAEQLEKHIEKGVALCVSGTPEARAYMGKDGAPRSSLDVIINQIEFLPSQKAKETTSATTSEEAPMPEVEGSF